MTETMTTFNFMLSGSDEEILNALIIADDIATESNSAASYSYEKPSDLLDTYVTNKGTISVFVSDFSEDSGCPKFQEFNKPVVDDEDLFQMEPEYQTLLQNVSSLQVLCDLCIERHRNMAAKKHDMIQSLIKDSKPVLSVDMLKENLVKIETALSHTIILSKQFRQIKQLLGNGPSKNTLKVNPSSQKNVLKFFHLANELMEHIEKNKRCIEACLESGVDHWNPLSRQNQLQISKILEEMERRIDKLTELRNNVGVICTKEEEVNNETIQVIDTLDR